MAPSQAWGEGHVKEDLPLWAGKEPFRVKLRLRRYGPDASDDAVLVLHGANTGGGTFLEPEGGIARFLAERGWRVWLLDWRGSPDVVRDLGERLGPGRWLGGSAVEEIRHYTVDDVAREDIPAALRHIRDDDRRTGSRRRLSVLGHCVGGGALSIAIAMGLLRPFGVECVVLSTMGLFYEVGWSSWIKAEDFILERVLGNARGCGGVSPARRDVMDPRAWPWPADLEDAYRGFPGTWLPANAPGAELYRRLCFMIGKPYTLARLDPRLSRDRVERMFGPLHLGLYLHVCQMVRRGYAAPLGAPDVIDRTRLGTARGLRARAPGQDHLDPEPFRELRTTLLCAAANQVWHRDAMDLMYEWLRGHRAPVVKKVFPGDDIQDLYWGAQAEGKVYPTILEGLRPGRDAPPTPAAPSAGTAPGATPTGRA